MRPGSAIWRLRAQFNRCEANRRATGPGASASSANRGASRANINRILASASIVCASRSQWALSRWWTVCARATSSTADGGFAGVHFLLPYACNSLLVEREFR